MQFIYARRTWIYHSLWRGLEKYQGELLVAGESDQILDFFEGEFKKNAKITLFRFPLMEHLKGFWHNKEYQAIKHLRTVNSPPNFTFAVNAVDFSKWQPV